MSDKNATSTAPVDRPSAVRNIALVGHTGAGKTTLVEALLHAAGAIPRMGRIEDGTTVSDHDEAEARQQRSVALSLCSFHYAGVKVNLLDTPGYGDFVGELRAGLRAADGALFVVSAADGIDGATQQLWDECADVGMPRAVVITRLDSPRADFERMVAICQRVLGDKHDSSVLPLYLPLESDDGHVGGLIGLLSQRIMDYSGGVRVEREPDDEHLPLIADQRDALIEAIIAESEDETLMDRYLAGEAIDTKVLIDDLETAVARGSFYPVLAAAVPPQGSADSGPIIGMAELLEVLTSAFPSPLEHELPAVTRPDGSPHEPLVCDPEGPLVAEVVKTASDPYVGRLSLVRVFSGTLRPDAPVHVSGHTSGHVEHDVDEKVGHLTTGFGKTTRPVSHCIAGDIVQIGRLLRAETGDTLSAKDDPLLIQAWQLPQPLLPIAIQAHSKQDEDKLAQGLARLVAEDPTVRLERSHETGQQLLWCMGEAHVDVLLERLRSRHGVELDQIPVRVPLRETFGAEASGHGRHVKQSGGHGQFAVVDLTVRPLAVGRGLPVHRQDGRRVRTAPVRAQRRQGGTGPARARAAGRLSRGRRRGRADRRQGAQRRQLGHGLPDGRRPRPEGRGHERGHAAARAGAVGRGRDRRRTARRGDERPVHPPWPGAPAPSPTARAAPSYGPRFRRPSCCATRSSCAR